MSTKDTQLQMVHDAIANLEQRGALCAQDVELFGIIVRLGESIENSPDGIDWMAFLPILVKISVEIAKNIELTRHLHDK